MISHGEPHHPQGWPAGEPPFVRPQGRGAFRLAGTAPPGWARWQAHLGDRHGPSTLGSAQWPVLAIRPIPPTGAASPGNAAIRLCRFAHDHRRHVAKATMGADALLLRTDHSPTSDPVATCSWTSVAQNRSHVGASVIIFPNVAQGSSLRGGTSRRASLAGESTQRAGRAIDPPSHQDRTEPLPPRRPRFARGPGRPAGSFRLFGHPLTRQEFVDVTPTPAPPPGIGSAWVISPSSLAVPGTSTEMWWPFRSVGEGCLKRTPIPSIDIDDLARPLAGLALDAARSIPVGTEALDSTVVRHDGPFLPREAPAIPDRVNYRPKPVPS